MNSNKKTSSDLQQVKTTSQRGLENIGGGTPDLLGSAIRTSDKRLQLHRSVHFLLFQDTSNTKRRSRRRRKRRKCSKCKILLCLFHFRYRLLLLFLEDTEARRDDLRKGRRRKLPYLLQSMHFLFLLQHASSSSSEHSTIYSFTHLHFLQTLKSHHPNPPPCKLKQHKELCNCVCLSREHHHHHHRLFFPDSIVSCKPYLLHTRTHAQCNYSSIPAQSVPSMLRYCECNGGGQGKP